MIKKEMKAEYVGENDPIPHTMTPESLSEFFEQHFVEDVTVDESGHKTIRYKLHVDPASEENS